MDKKNDRRPDRQGDQKNKRQHQQSKRGHEFGTFEDAFARRSKGKREAKQRKNDSKTRCAFCGGHMKLRGAVGHAGHLRSKCRKCGRTTWIRPDFKPPVPLVPTSKFTGFGRMNVRMRRIQERVHTQPDERGATDQ